MKVNYIRIDWKRKQQMLTIRELHPQYITNEKGEKTSVIIPITEFMHLIEDIEDLSVVAERQSESTTSHKDFLSELSKDGII